MNQILGVMLDRLASKGMAIHTIPAYIRDLSNAISDIEHFGLEDLNRRLQFLGWRDIELDDHTFQLIISNLETHAFTNPAHGMRFRFKEPIEINTASRNPG